MKRAGFVCLLHMVMLRTGPDPISPYLLRTAIEGVDAALIIDHAFMRLVDPSLYESLRPWLEFERNVSLPSDPSDPLWQLIAQADIDVSPQFPHCGLCSSSVRSTVQGHFVSPR